MGAPPNHMALAVGHVCYMKNCMATTARCEWLTPYKIIHRHAPAIVHCMPFYTKAFVHIPKDKQKIIKKGQGHLCAEEGRLVGYHNNWSTTFKVLLSENRIVHSRNVTFGISDFKIEASKAKTLPSEELLTSKFIKGLSLPTVARESNGSTHPEDQIDSDSIPEGDMPSPHQQRSLYRHGGQHCLHTSGWRLLNASTASYITIWKAISFSAALHPPHYDNGG